jgi:hypothetical protein
MTCWKHCAAAAVVALLTCSVSEAAADEQGLLVLAGAATLPIAGNVTAVGTHIKMAEGEPSKEWGRTTMILGIPNALLGGIFLIAGAAGNGDGRTTLYALGGLYLGTAVHSLVSGIINEAVLPVEDPGIEGRDRPASPANATMFHIGGRF